jgi:hypothetical protein
MTMSLKRLLLAATVTAASWALLDACGDDGEDSPASSPTPRRDAGTTVKGPGFTVQMPAKPKRETDTPEAPARGGPPHCPVAAREAAQRTV